MGFERLFVAADRIAVVDVETTGLWNVDRIVEVAVVTIDRRGVVVDEFETLVNPHRDVGPTWLHRVTASMVSDAPTFEEIATHVAARLDGAICAAHNLPFDCRMLAKELSAARVDVHWGAGLDTLRVTGTKLGVACSELGIAVGGAHSALVDARAAAELLVRLADRFEHACTPAKARFTHVTPVRVRTRRGAEVVDVPAPYLAELARDTRAVPDVAPYVDLLGRAIADLQLTPREQAELAAVAAEVGLDAAAVERAHREFLDGLVGAAVADRVITEVEYDQLCRAAALLGVDRDRIAQRTDGLRSVAADLVLTSGLRVCFTGEAVAPDGDELPRDDLESLAAQHGLIPTRSVTAKGCDLLVAADPATRSGKAANARRHGVAIAAVDDFVRVLGTGAPLAVTRLASGGVALVCELCGRSWVAGRSAARPLCADCSAARKPPAARPPPRPAASGATEALTCERCGTIWQRKRARGPKPKRCSACASGRT